LNFLFLYQYARRCIIQRIPYDFIINVNIVNNQTINIHNHIYNNREMIEANKRAVKEIAYSTEG